MVEKSFKELLNGYTNINGLIDDFWTEVEKGYTGKGRFYHTLTHLDNLFLQLFDVRTEIKSWDAILFALFYHDMVYDPLRSDNEEMSAELGAKRMKEISVPDQIIDDCKSHILATKKHDGNTNSDTNYFTDADLSVLGQDWEVYSEYYRNVRKEYSFYPDLIYSSGRKKVLNHFLSMDKIFKTEFFFARYEQQAKKNLRSELALLGL